MTEDELSEWLSTYCEFTVDEYGATGYAIPYDKLGPLVDFINGRTDA